MTCELAGRRRLTRGVTAAAALLITTTAVVILLAWGRLVVMAEAITPEAIALQPVLTGLQAREAAITGASADYTLELEENQDPEVLAHRDPDMGPSVARLVTEGYFTFDRGSFFEDRRRVYPEVDEGTSFTGSDGQQGRVYDAAAKWGEEIAASRISSSLCSSSVGSRLSVAHNFFPGEPTQSSSLLEAKAEIVGNDAELGGAKCYLLQVEREDKLHGKVTERWWVSPERGWLVLKHERIASGNGGESVGGKLTRSIEDCAQVDGVWMPTVLTVKGEQTQPDGSSLWVMKEKLTLAYRGVNKPVPAATFRPEFPTGTKVIGPDGARVVGQ